MSMPRPAGFAPRSLFPALAALAISALALAAAPLAAFASELDLQIPVLDTTYQIFGQTVSGQTLLMLGLGVCVLGMVFGLIMFNQVKRMPAHQSMLDVSNIIYETCKTYLLQQGRLLAVLEVFIGACIVYYFGVLQHMTAAKVGLILMWSVVGILGSYSVAWFGIRMNTYANSRTAFASLRGKPLPIYEIPLQAGMSIGVLLICVELIMMLIILLFVPKEAAGASFLGFAIGESLGASALRIARRHLHQDRRHRLRSDEGGLQDQGRRPAQSRRDRRLHRRQRRRLGGPDRRRLRDLRRDRRGADLASSRWR